MIGDETAKQSIHERARCRCCGGREVKRIAIREGDREWVIVECKFCEQRRGAYYRKAKK